MRKTNIKLKNKYGEDMFYSDIDTIAIEGEDGNKKEFSLGSLAETSVTLDFENGNQVINAPDDELYHQVTIIKPDTFKPENIAQGVVIAGVEGTFEGAREMPTLNAPTIVRNNDTITITNPSTNGNFTKGFNTYANDELAFYQTATTFSLADKFEAEKDYSIWVTCVNPLMNESDSSASLEFSIYSIVKELPEYVTTTDKTTKISSNIKYTFTLVPDFGFWLSENIDVYKKENGSEAYEITDDYSYSIYTGIVTISTMTCNLKFILGCVNYAYLKTPEYEMDNELYTISTDFTKYSQRLHLYVDDEEIYTLMNEVEEVSQLESDTYSINDETFIVHLANANYDNKKAPYISHNIYLDDEPLTKIKEEVIWR